MPQNAFFLQYPHTRERGGTAKPHISTLVQKEEKSRHLLSRLFGVCQHSRLRPRAQPACPSAPRHQTDTACFLDVTHQSSTTPREDHQAHAAPEKRGDHRDSNAKRSARERWKGMGKRSEEIAAEAAPTKTQEGPHARTCYTSECHVEGRTTKKRRAKTYKNARKSNKSENPALRYSTFQYLYNI